MGETFIVIEETQSADGKTQLRAGSAASRGDTVTWIFKGKLAEQDLRVRNKQDHSIIFATRPRPGEVSDVPFPIKGMESPERMEPPFEYEIIDSKGVPIPWANGSGECIKHPGPPH